jgi:Ni,Fe-hydrogenase III small subunit
MKNPLRLLTRLIDRWAAQRVVRVALFGQGLAASEWESLTTTPYQRLRPRIQLVAHPSQAEVLAIHGPLSTMNWAALLAWVANGRADADLIAVGPELELTAEGHLRGPQQLVTPFRVRAHVPGHPPTPHELRQAIACVVAHV